MSFAGRAIENSVPGPQPNLSLAAVRADARGNERLDGQVMVAMSVQPGGTLLIINTANSVYESDDQGIVHGDVPVGRSGRRVDVLVVWTDAGEPGDSEGDESGMADLVGLLKGVDPERPPQGEYEKRDPIA